MIGWNAAGAEDSPAVPFSRFSITSMRLILALPAVVFLLIPHI